MPGKWTAADVACGMVRRMVRAAVDDGIVFTPYRVTVDGAVAHVPAVLAGVAAASRIAFAVEGPLDESIVGRLGHAIVQKARSQMTVETYPAFGVVNAARLAGSFREGLGHRALVGIVVDSDDEAPEARQARLGVSPEKVGSLFEASDGRLVAEG